MPDPASSMSAPNALGELRRAKILEFVGDYWTANGYAPTMREVARGVGLAAPSAAHRQVTLLAAAGLVVFTPGVARSLRVVQQAVDE